MCILQLPTLFKQMGKKILQKLGLNEGYHLNIMLNNLKMSNG